VVSAEIGDHVAIARKDRGSENWYLGAVTDETARTVQVKLDFLDPAKRYTAQIYRDGEGADYRTDKRHAITIESRAVKAGETLSLPLAPGGGAAVRFVAK